MKKFLLIFSLVVVIFLWVAFAQGGAPRFFAQILRDGDYVLNLVNKQNTLRRYAPADLVELSELGAPGKYIRSSAYEPLRFLVFGARDDGVPLKIISAYRSYDKQKSLFAFWSRRYDDADTFSAEAGHSEHQLGTTVDFGVGDSRTDFQKSFANTPQGRWLEANAWRYGFVMSYPEGKERETGFVYEPWHFRYIGVVTAKEVQESGLALVEYLSTQLQYYLLIRAADDYRIWRVEEDGSKRWIMSEAVFFSLGYTWNDVALVTREEFEMYPPGEPIY